VSLADQTLSGFLAATAEATPAPGGGSSAAVVCALAAGLVEMAASIEATGSDVPGRARALRLRALELAEAELGSYAPVLEARRLPADDPARSEAIEAALVEASRSPLAIAEAAAQVAELGAQVAGAAKPSVRGDAVTGVQLAEAAASAAAGLVATNLEGLDAGELADRADAARAAAESARRRSSDG
jgi:methenyltetrahydrofolate cyclohydrolase